MGNISKLAMLPLILVVVCLISQPANAETSIYVFDANQSTVVQTGGFAGVNETYGVEGKFQLTVDFDTGIADFDKVDANLTESTGFLYTQSLDVLFNMTGLAGTLVDDMTIEFEGKTADGTESDVRLSLSFSDDSAYLTGNITPPPNTADMLLYDVNAVATRKYAGGTGEPNDPYQIATAEDLMTLGETPEDYDKHFILTSDIDLDPNLPGGKVFDKAVIAPHTNDTKDGFQGILFAGVFDGNSHVIHNLRIKGEGYLGLFGLLGYTSRIYNLGLERVSIVADNDRIGILAGSNSGFVSWCYSIGCISGNDYVGGLVGLNDGSVARCYSTAEVTGSENVGGLVGGNGCTNGVTDSYANGNVKGGSFVGGLVGVNYTPGAVVANGGCIVRSYSTAVVSGENSVGGLVGSNVVRPSWRHSIWGVVVDSFWDTHISGQTMSDGGIGLTTPDMKTAKTYLNAGWDMWGERENGLHEIWAMPLGGGYPVLAVFDRYAPPELQGMGTLENPYLISNSLELGAVYHYDSYAYYRLVDSIDLLGINWGMSIIPLLHGIFDGGGHTISHLSIQGEESIGLFNELAHSAVVRDLGILDVSIGKTSKTTGSLAAYNGGLVTNCYSTGIIKSTGWAVGGLVGYNWGTMIQCHSNGSVGGVDRVGGLVGHHDLTGGGTINNCYSTGIVAGNEYVGGLVGLLDTIEDLNSIVPVNITMSYSTCVVDGNESVGGLVGRNWRGGIATSYSTGAISGNQRIGGLVGGNYGLVAQCNATSSVSGRTDVGGLVGYNGHAIVHCYSTGSISGTFDLVGPSGSDIGGLVGSNSGDITSSWCTGAVNGTVRIGGLVGFCGSSRSSIAMSYSRSVVSGATCVGGIAGYNYGSITASRSASDVYGTHYYTGGLVGRNWGNIATSYSTGVVRGDTYVGGLAGDNYGSVITSYSVGTTIGNEGVGGITGENRGSIMDSFWDITTSELTNMCGYKDLDAIGCDDSYGKTAFEMQASETFTDAGWDFVGETDNGTEDIWWILEGWDYPRLWWELPADDFEDGDAGPLWFVYEPDMSKIWIEETNGRLEVYASELADDIDAAYASNGWRLDVTKDFNLKVDFHYGKLDAGDSWVMVGLLPSLAQPVNRIITFEAGCMNEQPFYLYEAIDGYWRKEETSDRSTDDGTLYVSYNAATDELYLSYTGYGKVNAWRTVTGLLKDKWAVQPVYVAIGGGSDQTVLDAGDAYLDDFTIDSGVLDFTAETNDSGD